MNNKVVDIVTKKILTALEQGHIPWNRGWNTGNHKYFANGRAYNGINRWILQCAMDDGEYTHPLWITFNKAVEMGGMVRKGEHGTAVVFWQMLKVDDKDSPGKKKTIPYLKFYNVFNVDQIDGLDVPPVVDIETLPKGEDILKLYTTCPPIKYSGDSAFYAPKVDKIGMPIKSSFHSSDDLYSVLFHEMVHSTGHKSRLNRDEVQSPMFGTEPYAKEELVAELGSAILCHTIGIERLIDNAAAYCQSWLRKLNEDKTMILSASSKADKAVDYIMGKSTVALEEGE